MFLEICTYIVHADTVQAEIVETYGFYGNFFIHEQATT